MLKINSEPCFEQIPRSLFHSDSNLNKSGKQLIGKVKPPNYKRKCKIMLCNENDNLYFFKDIFKVQTYSECEFC